MTKLFWVNNGFIDKELYAPFVVEKDLDYLIDLQKRYYFLRRKAKMAGADEKSVKIISDYSKKVCDAVKAYYSGKISLSHTKIRNLIKDCQNNLLAVSAIDKSAAFPGEYGTEIQFYRARISSDPKGFKANEMLHLPLSMRGMTGNYRFSIPGIPSLYLANSSYACWIETGMPAEHDFNVSPVILDGSQKILNLAVASRNLLFLNGLEEDRVHCWLKLLILMIATSYTIQENNRTFKSEYIVSQSIMLACKELGLDGVAYFSKRVDDEVFAYSAINLALFANYKGKSKYSEICNHLKIDDSYNYAMFKQLTRSVTYKNYILRTGRTGLITNIGNYKRQYSYSETEFCNFDKFMFASWNDKDTIPWGNALL
jgi:hypothetical protein